MELTEKEDHEAAPREEESLVSDGNLLALEALAEQRLCGPFRPRLDRFRKGMEAIPDVRRGLAKHVNVAPRDVRVGRLLRLTLRLLPEGNQSDVARATSLKQLSALVSPLKRWMRRRLEARHSGASGDFLADAAELGVALERIPGLGRHLPLEEDEWPLPSSD